MYLVVTFPIWLLYSIKIRLVDVMISRHDTSFFFIKDKKKKERNVRFL